MPRLPLVLSLLAACTPASAPVAAPRTAPPTAPAPPRLVPLCMGSGSSAGPGTIHGVATDWKSGEALPGVTVIVTSPSQPQAQATLTDDSGVYSMATGPGTYLVTFYYLDLTIQRADVPVAGGCSTGVSQRIDPAGHLSEEIHL